MLKVLVRTAVVVWLLAWVPGQAQEATKVGEDVNWRIRRETTANSQIARTLHQLTDRFGPRLTGSPNLKQAAEWALNEMRGWGLTNGRLEPWDFGHPGWLNERLSAHVIAPVRDHLVAEASAWTPGTNGPVRGPVLRIDLPERPTPSELDEFLDGLAPRIGGSIAFIGRPREVAVTFNPAARRREDRDLEAQFDPDRGPMLPAAPLPAPESLSIAPPDGLPRLSPREIEERVNAFLVGNGALARIDDAGRDHGQIRAFGNRTYDVSKVPATLVLRNEDYGRIWRLVADGLTVELDLDVVNRTFPEGRTMYNVVAEIPGGDKAAEVVMLGAHLDSWHAATGATDNAVGCAVVMEAARILSALGARPRRTIRVALWSGEEQGLLGSQAYVREHFGTFENPKPAFSKFSGYVNVDSGTGRIRGATVFGPREAAAVVREALQPFADLGVVGATFTMSRRRGGSDHTSFNEAGLPGIGMMLDPIEYTAYTWHTNLDTYERVVLDDAQKSAAVVAATVYHLAIRDEPLPRFTPEWMPKLPGRGSAPQATGSQR